MLVEVAKAGVYVSAHPATIRKLGDKSILWATRELSWAVSSDTRRYSSVAEMEATLSQLLVAGEARVLKLNRGQSGSGVWKIAPAPGLPTAGRGGASPRASLVVVQKAKKRLLRRCSWGSSWTRLRSISTGR